MDDLISEFITETSESLAVLDMELVKLEQNPNDKEILGNIFRLVHTIKGTCGFLGLPRLEHVAHAGENILGKIRDDEIEVTPGAISAVLEALDHITSLIDYLSENGEEPEGSDEELIAKLNEHANGGGLASPPPAAETPAQQEPDTQNEGTGGVTSQEEMDALERAFQETEVTIDGGTGGVTSQEEMDALERAFQETEVTIDGGTGGVTSQEEMDALERAFQETEVTIDGGGASAPASAETPKLEEKPKPADKPEKKPEKKAAPAEPKEAQAGANLANQSIRVNIGVLENLMQMVGELVLTRNQLMQIVRNKNDNELKTPLQTLSHITTELQEGVMKTRMQPIGNAWAKFPRLIRDLSIDLEKKIELRMVGAETELDRQLLEMIKDPLTHMVRNSCDHGLEVPADREEAGKSATGTVTLSAYHEGGHIIIKIVDDGRGVNIEKISEKAIESGITTEDELASLTDQQIAQFIFKPGFSTAEQVTSVSGRGVGMDVVRTNIEKIGGNVELTSEPGKGSTFHIKIPLTLAIVSVLIVEVGGERFAIPQINVLELVRAADDSEHKIEQINGYPVLRLRDKLLPLVPLQKELQLPKQEKESSQLDAELGFEECDEEFIVVCKVGGYDMGVIVDRVFDTEEIVVKPVSSMLQDIDVFSGNTILGDGSVIMILDPNGMSRLIGEEIGGGKEPAADDDAIDLSEDRTTSFLLFKSGEGAPRAVPLELVSRLEEIEVDQFEHSGNKRVIQYRGDLMQLTTLGNGGIPVEGKCEVIVFTYDKKTIGLVVDEILDIIEAPMTIKLGSDDEALLGSVVMQGKTTDIVDVGYLLRDLIDDDSINDLRNSHDLIDSAHVMLVEDSVFFRRLTVSFLTKLGYKVSDYGMAHEALNALNQDSSQFDIIVTDIEMPEMDGFKFSERVRSVSEFDNLPIIAFTSTINQGFIEKGEDIGIAKFVLKTERDLLVKEINDKLNSVKNGEEAA